LFAPIVLIYYNNLQNKSKKARVDLDDDSMGLTIDELLDEIATSNVWFLQNL